jgi:hypothetical protein
MSLVLSAAAACYVFDRRSWRAHYLQPPAQLGFDAVTARLLELSSMQLHIDCIDQRPQLLCCGNLLSMVALRLARARHLIPSIKSELIVTFVIFNVTKQAPKQQQLRALGHVPHLKALLRHSCLAPLARS